MHSCGRQNARLFLLSLFSVTISPVLFATAAYAQDMRGSTEDGYMPGVGANTGCQIHDGDYAPAGPDWTISLAELLRMIQFFNSDGYHSCPGAGTVDGFCPGL